MVDVPFGSPRAGRPQSGGDRRKFREDQSQLAQYPVSLRRIGALFTPHRGTLILVVLLIVAASLIGLIQPFIVRDLIDHAIVRQDVPALLGGAGGLVAIAVLTALLGVIQTWRATLMGQRVMHGLRTSLFNHVQRQSLGFFTRSRSGEVQSRLINDVGQMQSVVTTAATSIASNLTTVVATAVAMVAISWRLSLISLIVLPPAILLTKQVANLRRKVTARRQSELSSLTSLIEERLSVSGIRLAKIMGTTQADAQRFADSSSRLIDLEMRSQLAGRWRMASMSVIFAVVPALLYLAAGLPATSGGMTIGTLVAFTGLQAGIFRPVMGLMGVSVQWVSALALFSRVFEYLDLNEALPVPQNPRRLSRERVHGEVEISGVRFSYPGSSEPTLHGIDLCLPAGQVTAVVGATGSGKSTLGALLARLADPDEGVIRLDGHDLRQLDPSDLAGLVGVVSQESYLLHGTVRENLQWVAPDASDEQIWAALEDAQIAQLIRSLPDGLETMVGQRGHRFSGGEQQRLAIARTILRNPRVLVLDEATSALDTVTESLVQKALDRLARGRTTLLIAHRLSTISRAQNIVVLDAGRIVESGSFEQLAAKGGAFARLLEASDQAQPVST